jgi:hypothetical protein
MYLQDVPDNSTIGEHVEIVIVPLARWTRSRGALETSDDMTNSVDQSLEVAGLFIDLIKADFLSFAAHRK